MCDVKERIGDMEEGMSVMDKNEQYASVTWSSITHVTT